MTRLRQDPRHTPRHALCHLVLALVLGPAVGLTAAAGPPAPKDAAARYQQERAACLRGDSHQSRATCLREAGAALQEARGGRAEPSGAYADNALRRCDALPGSDRADCIARIQGQGSISGSVGGGGVYRELVTKDKAPPAAPVPRP